MRDVTPPPWQRASKRFARRICAQMPGCARGHALRSIRGVTRFVILCAARSLAAGACPLRNFDPPRDCLIDVGAAALAPGVRCEGVCEWGG